MPPGSLRVAVMVSIGVVLLSFAWANAGWALPWSFDFEAAMVNASRNDLAAPGDTGTRFSLVDDLKTDEDVAFRLRLGRQVGDRHHLSALYAPLRLHANGAPGFVVAYEGAEFAADADLSAVYTFNSYRFTWRYDAIRQRTLDLGLGLTAKVRDAFIELSDGQTTARKENVGFVPLAHVRLDWRWSSKLGLLLEADALAAPQGRAEDALVAFTLRPWDQGTLRLGYRLLEGGADNDEVYSFALIHYYVFSWSQRF